MFRSRFLMAAFVAAIAALAGPATSQAAFSISASDGLGSSATINDNNIGNPPPSGTTSGVSDTNASLNGITTPQILAASVFVPGQFSVGAFQIGIDATTNSTASNSNFSTSSHTFVRNTGSSAGTLTLSVSNVFILPLNVNMTLSQTLTILQFLKANGTPYPTHTNVLNSVTSNTNATPTSTNTGPVGGPLEGFYFNSTTFTRTNLFFTMTQTFTIHLNAGEAVQFQGAANVDSIPGDNLLITPAPAGLILAATGLPFLGLLRRRMRRTETAVAA